jgi:hypothetical protein
VTGVPGAGKTLVGLNLATQRRDPAAPTHAVFLSGNGPLVAVVRAGLATRPAPAPRDVTRSIWPGYATRQAAGTSGVDAMDPPLGQGVAARGPG